ncbi:MAG: cytochrome c biogenesis protein CcdA [Brevinematales bacterium]|nr:cytochrome c biogenesis protein CcdA [Brevinematales bacterium]
MYVDIGILVAFVAGILSFLSPCILPLVLPYISFISGISVLNMKDKNITTRDRVLIILSTAYFVLGFTIVFLLFGIVAGQIGGILISIKDIMSRIAGIIILAFGLHLIGIIRISFLDYERRITSFTPEKSNFFTSFVMGLLFAFGWTPCIGPILGGITSIAFYSGNLIYGGVLLFVYSLGLSIPFLLVSIFINSAVSLISKLKKVVKVVEVTSGIILILIGLALVTDSLGIISGYLLDLFPFLGTLG